MWLWLYILWLFAIFPMIFFLEKLEDRNPELFSVENAGIGIVVYSGVAIGLKALGDRANGVHSIRGYWIFGIFVLFGLAAASGFGP